ncbi:baculoviral IAP repeat-containing protein 1b-like isoform X2 [Protopterus annectens]|uniref:baculoviral IAP repeat-containing protein 1b-like isoform X1 n=1 Tax=Protopterus annectens TaxID=7888 RepID=UPI001CFB4AB1|nr:baculoviral IAP repeat-containing protein 1b-like isoform X1 [Protopterus annectens]XP_043919865.1 baculoviral IAP repeat-containing protein 1b-like isoform X2 [Protopterus annectens]
MCFPATEDLMTALCSCKQLREIVLHIQQMSDDALTALVSSLPGITTLQILDLSSQYFTSTKASEAFANSLGLLNQLQVLKLPQGEGITATAKSIVHQFWHLPHLTHLKFANTLNDDGVLELASVAKAKALCRLQKLDLSTNLNITDSGWKDFFLTLDEMKCLQHLTLSTAYTCPLKPHPATVRAFVQCVSRLPNLVNIHMLGWLLDEQDFNMFNDMKKYHPQSKRMHVHWQWLLPFQTAIN